MTRLSSPAPGRAISSPFGPRIDPISGKQSTHHGIDWGGSFPVLAAGDGVVRTVAFSASGIGHYVIIEHSPTLRTVYGHGANRSKLTQGQRVTVGQLVFQSGSTGYSTGNHLHFEVRVPDQFKRWVRVNPADYLGVPAPEIEDDVKTVEGFFATVDGVPSWVWINWATGRVFSVHTHAEADHVGSYMGSVEVLTDSPTATAGEKYKALIHMAQALLVPVAPAGGVDTTEVAKAVDAALKDDFATVNANVNKPRTVQ